MRHLIPCLQFLKRTWRRQPEKKFLAATRWVAASVLLACGTLTLAQSPPTFPSKPIHWIVDYPAGGLSDILARTVGQKLSEAWSTPVVVDNRPGANGMIAYEQVAKSVPDGYTLGLVSTPFALNLSLYASVAYNTQKDFAPVSLIAATPNVLVCSPRLPVKNVKDLIALAKAKPGTLNYASVGIGSSPHLSAELFKRMAAIEMVHVPYNGSGPALTDLIGGRTDLMFVNLPAALPHIRTGKLTLLAVAGAIRSAVVPEAPTMIESGLPGFVSIGWYGAVLPAGVPSELVARYAAEIARIVRLPEVRERILALGAEARAMTPAEYTAYINEEISRWGKIVRESGARATN